MSAASVPKGPRRARVSPDKLLPSVHLSPLSVSAGVGWECMGRGEWEGVHIIIMSSLCVHSAPRGRRCCWSGRWSQCRLATGTAGRWHKRKPRRRSGGSRRTRSCWGPSPQAAASGESCERPARSVIGERWWRRRVGERSDVGVGWRKEMTEEPCSKKSDLIYLNIHELLNCGFLKCLYSCTSILTKRTKQKTKQNNKWGESLSLVHAVKIRRTAETLPAPPCDWLSVPNKITKQWLI